MEWSDSSSTWKGRATFAASNIWTFQSSTSYFAMMKYCQMISPTYIAISAYMIFVCIIIDLTDDYLQAILNSIVAIITSFILKCLYDHFKTLPTNKQTILVHSTKLVIITNYLPVLRNCLFAGCWYHSKKILKIWWEITFSLYVQYSKWRYG